MKFACVPRTRDENDNRWKDHRDRARCVERKQKKNDKRDQLHESFFMSRTLDVVTIIFRGLSMGTYEPRLDPLFFASNPSFKIITYHDLKRDFSLGPVFCLSG